MGMDEATARALALVLSRTGHEPYRAFCAEDHPDHEAWRAEVRRMAARPWPPAAPDPLALALRDWWLEALALYRGDPPADCGCGGK